MHYLARGFTAYWLSLVVLRKAWGGASGQSGSAPNLHLIGCRHRGNQDWPVFSRGIQWGTGLWGCDLHFHGTVTILMLKISTVLAILAVSSERRTGNDSKLAGPLAILSGAAGRLWGDAAAVLVWYLCAVAVTIAIARRERGLAFDPTQHDQVDAAAIPALVCQITAKKTPRGIAKIITYPNSGITETTDSVKTTADSEVHTGYSNLRSCLLLLQLCSSPEDFIIPTMATKCWKEHSITEKKYRK